MLFLVLRTWLTLWTGVSNAEQAQVYLGVDENTSDDFIITMYTAKVFSYIGYFTYDEAYLC